MSAVACGSFNASSSIITYGNNLDFERTDSIVVGAWVKCASATPTTSQFICGKVDSATGQGWYLRLRGDVANDPWEFGLRSATGTGFAIQIPRTSDTNWHYVSGYFPVTLGHLLMQLSEDGILGTRTNVLTALSTTIKHTAAFSIGAVAGGTEFFDGEIGQVLVYSTNGTANTTPTVRELQNMMFHSGKQGPSINATALIPRFYAPLDLSGNIGRDLIGGLTPTVTDVTYTEPGPTDVFQGAGSIDFDGATSGLGLIGGTGINENMTTFTCIDYVYPESQGEGNAGRLMGKCSTTTNGWQVFCSGTNAITFQVDYATTDMVLVSNSNFLPLNEWSGVAVTFSSITATNNHIYVKNSATSGVWAEVTYATQQNGVGARSSDSTTSHQVGSVDGVGGSVFDGQIAGGHTYNGTQLTLEQIMQTRLRKPFHLATLIERHVYNGPNQLSRISNTNGAAVMHGNFGTAAARYALSSNAYQDN